ncbi:hypothetical protein V2I01_27155 [Micromonospora sp. BRA006-A]|nr:hypothetical protein [Micromonospora sp. BRA006-A]
MSWLTVDKSKVTLAPGEKVTVTVGMTASVDQPGTYSASVVIKENTVHGGAGGGDDDRAAADHLGQAVRHGLRQELPGRHRAAGGRDRAGRLLGELVHLHHRRPGPVRLLDGPAQQPADADRREGRLEAPDAPDEDQQQHAHGGGLHPLPTRC